MSKWNYVFGAVTIGLIVGGTIYVIKKSKDAEKLDETAISVDEAREILAREKGNVVEFKPVDTRTAEEKVDYREYRPAPINEREYELEDEEEEDDEGIQEILEDEPVSGPSPFGLTIHPITPFVDFLYEEPGIDPSEDKTLRYEPNSPEARDQYIRMELAGFPGGGRNSKHDIMMMLFETTFYPSNVGDDILRGQILDHKGQYFGMTSKWTREISFGDLVCHYARKATFDCGHFFEYWIEYFLSFNDFTRDMTTMDVETLTMRLASHTYFNEERQTFGLFGLTRESMDQAVRMANRNPDRSVTFEIEFQEFLKSCI